MDQHGEQRAVMVHINLQHHKKMIYRVWTKYIRFEEEADKNEQKKVIFCNRSDSRYSARQYLFCTESEGNGRKERIKDWLSDCQLGTKLYIYGWVGEGQWFNCTC